MQKKLTGRQERAAVFVAEDHFSDHEIAAKVGIKRPTLAKWKLLPLFCARVQEITQELAERALRQGIARRDRRLTVLQRTANRLLQVMEERAADPALAKIAGGKTGLIVSKPLASAGELLGFEYAVDTATIRELRATLEQAAKELGQFVERKDIRLRSLKDLSDEELAELLAELEEESPSSNAE